MPSETTTPKSSFDNPKSQLAPREPLTAANASIDALYLHVPFCFHKCHYCDFYSIVDGPATGDRQPAFLERLLAEITLRARQLTLRPRTIFIGGGTPTLLHVEHWQRLLEQLADMGIVNDVSEFTVEANPETVTAELMTTLRRGGVNRISMGAQSFDPALLKMLERWHDPASVARAVAITRAAGIDNINLDLIFAIPGQTQATLDADIDAALALEPEHISYYGLTYESNTAMTKRLEMGLVRAVDEDHESAMYAQVIQRLTAAGFEQYEVSNWARHAKIARDGEASSHAIDRRCQHNLLYWSNANWLGIGPAAASHLSGWRWKNQPHLGRYLDWRDEPAVEDIEHLSLQRRIGEQLMLGLRMRQGISLDWLAATLPGDDPRLAAIDELVQLAMLQRHEGHLRLTQRGLFVADAVIARLL